MLNIWIKIFIYIYFYANTFLSLKHSWLKLRMMMKWNIMYFVIFFYQQIKFWCTALKLQNMREDLHRILQCYSWLYFFSQTDHMNLLAWPMWGTCVRSANDIVLSHFNYWDIYLIVIILFVCNYLLFLVLKGRLDCVTKCIFAYWVVNVNYTYITMSNR